MPTARRSVALRRRWPPCFEASINRRLPPHVDTGDHVVIVNAEKIRLTGNKMEDKTYSYHTGYPGGLKTLTAEHIHKKDPTKLLTRAIEGMLPKNPLGNQMAKKLRVYAGSTHPHHAQQLESLSL
jgi:large subunit ribosomal protein L13